MAIEEPDLPRKLAYEESVRALELQSTVLDDLRSRTGILLSASAIASTFLGAQALRDSSLGFWSWAAIVGFACSGLACLRILWPGGDWTFSANANDLLDNYVDDGATIDEMHEELARHNQDDREENVGRLGDLFSYFRLGVIALIFQVSAWLIVIGNSHG